MTTENAGARAGRNDLPASVEATSSGTSPRSMSSRTSPRFCAGQGSRHRPAPVGVCHFSSLAAPFTSRSVLGHLFSKPATQRPTWGSPSFLMEILFVSLPSAETPFLNSTSFSLGWSTSSSGFVRMSSSEIEFLTPSLSDNTFSSLTLEWRLVWVLNPFSGDEKPETTVIPKSCVTRFIPGTLGGVVYP